MKSVNKVNVMEAHMGWDGVPVPVKFNISIGDSMNRQEAEQFIAEFQKVLNDNQ